MSLYELALTYAELKKTKILSSREEGREITFVLESGQKLTFTKSQLEIAIESITQAGAVTDGTPPPSIPAKAKKKGK